VIGFALGDPLWYKYFGSLKIQFYLLNLQITERQIRFQSTQKYETWNSNKKNTHLSSIQTEQASLKLLGVQLT
jgi:hypothetical protein